MPKDKDPKKKKITTDKERKRISRGQKQYMLVSDIKKYQEESTNVSRVSVSLITFSPEGSFVCFQLGCFSKGFPDVLRSTSSGSNTGKSFFLTGIAPPFLL